MLDFQMPGGCSHSAVCLHYFLDFPTYQRLLLSCLVGGLITGYLIVSSIDALANSLCPIIDNGLQIMRGQSNKSNIGSGSSNERPLVAESGSQNPVFLAI